ncbi:MAG TPA: aminotransferase class I/II-fold pyridoxal phosphate-dependent enzyme [Terriglobales bacterium]|nr:aminotransferase class I/II-fold pyridoxal phosphate-dependent enzyme [Terriglobales bacterium]
MLLSRRRFVHMAGGVATAFTTLPLTAEALRSFQTVALATADAPVRLDSNENPYGPSLKVLESMRNSVSMSNRYPFHEYPVLVQRLAAMHDVQPDRVLVGCGSSEILRVAAVALLGPGKKFVQPSPTFETAEHFASLAGAEVISVPLDPHFAHDLEGMLSHIDAATRLVYICNPNNPTGSLTPRDALENFIAKLPSSTTVLIDEAYHHYALQNPGYVSFLDHPIADDRVIVCRTFSKVYGLAGMRLGYAVASPKLIAQLRPHITPISVNAVVIRCAHVALDDTENVQDCVRKNDAVRQEFFAQAAARSLKPINSFANFVMMDVHRPTKQVAEYFRKNNVWVGRDFPPFETSVRVTLGRPEEMKEFWRVYDLQAQST